MKASIILIAMIFSLKTFASDDKDANKAKRFAKKKTRALEGIEKRISMLQESKTCVSAATSREAIRECRQKAKSKRKSMKQNRRKKKK